jgi:predicted O-methyltransferase YrrM
MVPDPIFRGDAISRGKEALARAYRAIVAPAGRRQVAQLVSNGLPAFFEGPLGFLFGDLCAVDPAVCATIRKIEALRPALASRDTLLTVAEPVLDSPDIRRTPREVAYLSSVTEEWGTFLHLLARGVRAKQMLELGGCAGISGCYLASAPTCERFVTVEGSRNLAHIAGEHLAAIAPAARVVNGLFEDVLDEVLDGFAGGIDLAFVDGHKNGENFLPMVRRIMTRLSPGGLLVLDDIRWSRGMGTLWNTISALPGFSHALDVGRFGICVRDAKSVRPRSESVAVYTGWLQSAHH